MTLVIFVPCCWYHLHGVTVSPQFWTASGYCNMSKLQVAHSQNMFSFLGVEVFRATLPPYQQCTHYISHNPFCIWDVYLDSTWSRGCCETPAPDRITHHFLQTDRISHEELKAGVHFSRDQGLIHCSLSKSDI